MINSNKITTITNELPENWKFVQIPDDLKAEGFSIAHILQLVRDGFFKPEEVQDSLENFLYDLQEGAIKPKLGPVRFFMGVMRKNKVPYVSQALIDQEKSEIEEYSKKIAAARDTQKQHSQMNLVKKFEEWWTGLTQVQKNNIAEPSTFAPEGGTMQENVARGMYLDDPEIANQV